MVHKTGFSSNKISEFNAVGTTLDLMGISFCVVDIRGNYVIVNHAAAKKNNGMLQIAQIEHKEWSRIMEQRRGVIGEESVAGKWYVVMKQPVLVCDECLGLVIISFDVTTWKEEQAGILYSTKNKQQVLREEVHNLQLFAHYFIYELRNVFQGVKNKIDALQFGLPLISEVAMGAKITKQRRRQLLEVLNVLHLLKKTMDSSVNFFELISVHLKAATISQEQFALCSIAEAWRMAMRDYHFQAGEGALLHCDLNQAFHFYGIEIYVTYIFLNLLKQALAAIKIAHRGEIFVRFNENVTGPSGNKKKFHCVIFCHTAQGLAADVIAKIFDPLMHADKVTGWELSFCKTVMQAFGGDITCASQLGKYTEFTLWFPVGIKDN